MKKLLVVFCLLAPLVFADSLIWLSNYDKGLALMGQGQYADGMAFLKMAAADKPISEIITEEKGTVDYLPYLQMGIGYYHLGKTQLALEFFDLEDALPAIKQSKMGQDLMREYKAKLGTRNAISVNKEAEKAIRNFPKKPYLLPEIEVEKMKEDIRQRCNLPKADVRSYPWYFHYELGLALKGKNDWQRALDSFISALDNRDRPQKFSRIYGMWFIDYYPYYNIGLAHYHLQNWKCADDAFRLSQMLEDIPADSESFRSLQEYRGEVQKYLMEEGKNQ